MKRISLITHHYNSHDKAQHLLDHLAGMDKAVTDHIEVIIVDDCSDTRQSLDSHGLDLKHLRVVDDIPWNQAGARNLGAVTANGEWLLYFDMDQLISDTGLKYVVNYCPALDRKLMYFFQVENFIDSNINEQMAVHPNTFMVNAVKFRMDAMYDEDFAGNYGYEDIYLPYLWEKNGGMRAMIGEVPFFTDQGFKTTSLSRDLEHNKLVSRRKFAEGLKRPKSFVRFEWEKVN